MHKFTYDVRNCYRPRPGYKFVTVDYNNLELIAVGHQLLKYYGKSVLADIINSGDSPTDLHSVFAAELMSAAENRIISYEDFMKNKKDPAYKIYRAKGKPFSLGRPGGMGMDTMRLQAETQHISLDYKPIYAFSTQAQARGALNKYGAGQANLRVRRTGKREWSVVFDEVVGIRKVLDTLYPDVKMFLSESHRNFLTGEVGFKYNDYGEREDVPYYAFETLGFRRDYCSYTEFCNAYLMQTPSAVGAKAAVYNNFRYWEDNDDVHMLMFVHDEIGAEVADNKDLDYNVSMINKIMIQSMADTFSRKVRVATEWTINDCWSKDGNEREGQFFMDAQSDTLREVA